jgi:HK97 family phage major capsid protein
LQRYSPACNENCGVIDTVPQEFYSLMEKRTLEQSVVRRSGAMVVPAARNTIKMPLFKDTTHSAGTLFGGWIAYMGAEASAMSESSPKIDQVTLELNKLYLYTYLSEELLEDNAVALEALLQARAGDVIAWKEDSKFLNGTGVGEPLGIINSSALVSYDKAAASAISIGDLGGMIATLFSNSFSKACWYAHPSTLKLLVSLTAGTYGNAVWIGQDQGATKAPPAMVFGMPLYWTEHCKEINTPGDFMLIDPTWYCIYDKPGLRIDIDKSVRFNYDQQTLRIIKRFDGRPLIDSAVTLASGTSTQSPFVAMSAS